MWQKTRLWFHVQAVTSLNDSLYPLKKKKRKRILIFQPLYTGFLLRMIFFPQLFILKLSLITLTCTKYLGKKKKNTGHNLSFLSKNIIRSVQDLLEMDVHFFTLSTLCISLRFMKLVWFFHAVCCNTVLLCWCKGWS